MFSGCTNLISIKTLETIRFIGDSAFYDCTSLQNINLEDVKEIRPMAFENCRCLSEINFRNAESVAWSAFNGCPIRYFDISENNPSYKTIDGVVYNKTGEKLIRCPQLCSLTHFVVPDSVIEIERDAFQRTNIESITIPPSVKKIGSGVFKGCLKLSSVNIQAKIEELSYCTFECCKSLKTIIIPDSVKEIHTHAFMDCCALESIKLSSNLLKIGDGAFCRCYSLKEIDFPDSLQEIEYLAFKDCPLNIVQLPLKTKLYGIGIGELPVEKVFEKWVTVNRKF
jgi:hypothetical protein